MRFFNWAESFKEQPTQEDILTKIQKIEILYRIFLSLSVLITIWGILIIIFSAANNFKALILGLFLAVDGTIQITLIKIWAHIKLSMFRIIWDNKNRIEAELRKSEAEDI